MLSAETANIATRFLDVFWSAQMSNGIMYRHLPYIRRTIAEHNGDCIYVEAKALKNVFRLRLDKSFYFTVNSGEIDAALLWPIVKPYGRWEIIAEKKWVKTPKVSDCLVEVRFGIACEHNDQILRQYIAISPNSGRYQWVVEKTKVDLTKVIM